MGSDHRSHRENEKEEVILHVHNSTEGVGFFLSYSLSLYEVKMTALILEVLHLLNEFADLMPNYEQKMRKKLFKLQTELNDELSKPSSKRNHGKLDRLIDDLGLFIGSFRKDLGSQTSTKKNVLPMQ